MAHGFLWQEEKAASIKVCTQLLHACTCVCTCTWGREASTVLCRGMYYL